MTDRDVEREVEANLQRKVDDTNARKDDDSLVGAAEEMINPLVNLFHPNDVEVEDVEQQRRLNDAEQRRGE